jgi:hypothetical protein
MQLSYLTLGMTFAGATAVHQDPRFRPLDAASEVILPQVALEFGFSIMLLRGW